MAVGEWPKGMVEDRYDFLFEAYNQSQGKVDLLFEVRNPKDGMFDQVTTGIGMGQLVQKATGDTSITFRAPTEGFTAFTAYRQFDDGLNLSRLTVERFPANKVKDLVETSIRSWGSALRRTEETFGSALFRRGGFTAGHADFSAVIAGLINQQTDNLAYDAKPFFNKSDNTRTSKGGTTYYNAISAILSVANYEALYELVFVTNAYDERDEQVDLKSMGQVVLVVPPQLRAEAFTVLEDEILAGAPNEQKNPWYKTAVPVEWDFLKGNATAWYVGVAKQGIRYYRASKPEIRMWRDENNGDYKASIWCLMGWLAQNFRFWGASNSPTS